MGKKSSVPIHSILYSISEPIEAGAEVRKEEWLFDTENKIRKQRVSQSSIEVDYPTSKARSTRYDPKAEPRSYDPQYQQLSGLGSIEFSTPVSQLAFFSLPKGLLE